MAAYDLYKGTVFDRLNFVASLLHRSTERGNSAFRPKLQRACSQSLLRSHIKEPAVMLSIAFTLKRTI